MIFFWLACISSKPPTDTAKVDTGEVDSYDGCWPGTDDPVPPLGAMDYGLSREDIREDAIDLPYDGIDQNCDGTDDFDQDGDGFVPTEYVSIATLHVENSGALPGGDCWDNSEDELYSNVAPEEVHPNAEDAWYDGVDKNCDGADDFDQDGDGFQSADHIEGGLDCNDTNVDVHPDALEVALDGVDQNCDGLEDCYEDGDGDGYGSSSLVSSSDLTCSSQGFSTNSDDCNDADSTVSPDGVEQAGDGVDQNCDGVDGCFVDSDGDGYGSSLTSAETDCTVSGASSNSDDCDDGDSSINPASAELALDGVDQNCDGLEDCYEDGDGDGYGSSSLVSSSDLTCSAQGFSTNSDDCNDSDGAINPASAELALDGVDQNCDGLEDCYEDGDGDGYGNSSLVSSSDLTCSSQGFSNNSNDCNDAEASIYPAAAEVAGDGVDQNCDGLELCYIDGDGDSSGSLQTTSTTDVSCSSTGLSSLSDDCDDGNAAISPSAFEQVGDGVDQNCDGLEDCYEDGDGDGYGSSSLVSSSDLTCSTEGFSTNSDDCNDADPTISPQETEVAGDGIDQDCNGSDGCFVDGDGDGYGSSVTSTETDCSVSGASSNSEDCDDGDSSINPASAELALDGVDQNCDGLEDCYEDGDGDGYGSSSLVSSSDLTCSAQGFSTNSADCDDGDSSINPASTEVALDGVDQNCDGLEDCYEDGDGDGYGGSATTTSSDLSCSVSGVSINSEDCDDGDASINPVSTEVVVDGIDQNCDGLELCYVDVDGDGVGSSSTMSSSDLSCSTSGVSLTSDDCNDGDASINPTATEVAGDGIDQNCDGSDGCFVDNDGDGYGSTTTSTQSDCTISGFSSNSEDCDDGDSSINPAGTEVALDGVDQNCDGLELCYADIDGDTYGGTSTTTSSSLSCVGTGVSAASDDCDDGDSSINPAGVEAVADGVDQNCDGLELCYADIDGDTYGGTSTTTSSSLSCNTAGVASASDDCDDGDASINPAGIEVAVDSIDQNCDGLELCYADLDGDGYGGSATTTSSDLSCSVSGVSINSDDCDDGDASINPAGIETAGDGIDQDCDGADGCFVDSDLDGYGSSTVSSETDCTVSGVSSNNEDCDDNNALISPAASEVEADGVDQDCDGFEDCYIDLDGDSFGSGTTSSSDLSCSSSGLSNNGEDCDDGDASISPVANEVETDGVDQDCDGFEACYEDLDEDGYGSSVVVLSTDVDCASLGLSNVDSDCDDDDAARNPGAAEVVADGVDSDCDGLEDCYEDTDLDTFGSSQIITSLDFGCTASGFSASDLDCNDSDNTIYPYAEDVSNDLVDSNCDGLEALGNKCDGTQMADSYLVVCSNLNLMRWSTAKNVCLNANIPYDGLASIQDSSEFATLKTLEQDSYINNGVPGEEYATVWLAYNDQATEGTWVWDGAESYGINYEAWHGSGNSSQPDNLYATSISGADCAAYVWASANKDQKWYDMNCLSSYRLSCSFRLP